MVLIGGPAGGKVVTTYGAREYQFPVLDRALLRPFLPPETSPNAIVMHTERYHYRTFLFNGNGIELRVNAFVYAGMDSDQVHVLAVAHAIASLIRQEKQ